MGLPNLADLEKKCADLGYLVKPAGKKIGKDDCVAVLRNHFLAKDFPNGLPYQEIEPMLCFAEWNLGPAELENVWNSPLWVADRKMNGCRMVLHFVKGVGVFAHGRNVSVKSFRYEEYSDRFLFKGFVPDFDLTIDTEAIIEKPINTKGYTSGGKGEMTKSSLHSTSAVMALEATQAARLQRDQDAPLTFYVFDVMKINGRDITCQPLEFRLTSLQSVEDLFAGIPAVAPYFQFSKPVRNGKKEYFKKVLAEGGEGVILKNLRAPYQPDKRRRDAWVKAKRRVEFDAFVSGFKRGEPQSGWCNLVGALEFSVNTEKGPHVLGYASNMEFETRLAISVYDPTTDTVTMKPGVYGKVAEISGQDVSARELRLSHCTMDRWRTGAGDEKTADQCVVTMAGLVAAAAWCG